MPIEKSRIPFLDCLRIIACFFVIVNHTNSVIFLARTPESLTWYASLCYFFVSKIAVPLFMIISGYLLLDRKDGWKKHAERMIRIMICIVACGVLYACYFALKENSGNVLSVVLKKVSQVHQGAPSNALWYLYAYLGILLMMPFLQKMSSTMSKTDYYVFFAISGLFVGVLPVLAHYNPFFNVSSGIHIPLFSSYICLFFVGNYFSKFGVKRTWGRFFVAFVLFWGMVAINMLATYYEFYHSDSGYLFMDNRTFFPIVTESICVFYMATFIQLKKPVSDIVSKVGACTFGIYLISDLLIDVLKPFYTNASNIMHPLFAVVLYELLILIVGLVITMILKCIPFVKKVL